MIPSVPFPRHFSIYLLPPSVLSGNTACASISLNPKLCQMSQLYLPICGFYMSLQVNFHVPEQRSDPSADALDCFGNHGEFNLKG